MLRPSDEQIMKYRAAVVAAADRVEVLSAVDEIYDALAQQIAERRPICHTSGRCCRFEEFGHVLFVTTAEMAAFVARLPNPGHPTPEGPLARPGGVPLPVLAAPGSGQPNPGVAAACPHQAEGLCTVHAIRPFGCRVFFCDETSTDWQRRQYEVLHARLKAVHERLGVPYLYLEWRQALAAMAGRSAG